MSTNKITHADIQAPMQGKINQEQVDDAVAWWAQLTGVTPANLDQPEAPVTIQPHHYADLRNAADGLNAIATLLSVANCSADSKLSSFFSGGLISAMVALSGQLSGNLDRLSCDWKGRP